jgi:hypothetical protein
MAKRKRKAPNSATVVPRSLMGQIWLDRFAPLPSVRVRCIQSIVFPMAAGESVDSAWFSHGV